MAVGVVAGAAAAGAAAAAGCDLALTMSAHVLALGFSSFFSSGALGAACGSTGLLALTLGVLVTLAGGLPLSGARGGLAAFFRRERGLASTCGDAAPS